VAPDKIPTGQNNPTHLCMGGTSIKQACHIIDIIKNIC